MTGVLWEASAGGVAEAAAALGRGGVIAFPTDTVFGLACDPLSAAAVSEVYRLKGRPTGMPLILMAADQAALRRHARLSALAEELAARFWPGPLTLIVEALPSAAQLGGQGTIAVRLPNHPLALQLLRLTGALATTSANPHGQPPVADAGAALRQLPGLAGALGAPSGPLAEARPSSILDLTRDPPVLVREGAVRASQLGVPLAPRQLGSRRD